MPKMTVTTNDGRVVANVEIADRPAARRGSTMRRVRTAATGRAA